MRRIKKFLKWLIPEAVRGGITYYSTKKGVEDGAPAIGDAVKKQGGRFLLSFKKKF